MNAPFVKEVGGGVQLSIKLQPRASRQQIGGVHGKELKISVTAPPVDAAANRALLEFLAEILDLPRSSMELVRGQTSRHKTLFIHGVSAAELMEKLTPHLA